MLKVYIWPLVCPVNILRLESSVPKVYIWPLMGSWRLQYKGVHIVLVYPVIKVLIWPLVGRYYVNLPPYGPLVSPVLIWPILRYGSRFHCQKVGVTRTEPH